MSIQHDLLNRLRDPRGQQVASGWAGRSLEDSIRRVLLTAMAVWQAVVVLTVVSSLGFSTLGWLVAASHVLALLTALAVLRFDRGQLMLILGTWLLLVVDWSVSPTPGSTLLFASCWMGNLTNALPAFLLRGRASWWAPLAAAAAVPVLMVIAQPEWASNPLVSGVPITLIAITVATRIGLSYVVEYAERADREAREVEQMTASLTTRKAATHQASEDARLLHDTAINTLGAIANGGAGVADADAVRRRCLADIAAIETLRSRKGDEAETSSGLRDAIRPMGIRVRYAGLSEQELTSTEALLPVQVKRALSRAAAEAVQNAAKHSGAEDVLVSITRTAEGLRLAVSDQGVGIQADLRRGGGVERSILQRAREVGISAAISSKPGQGTTVTLDYAFQDAQDESQTDTPAQGTAARDSVEDLLRQLRLRSVFALSAGLVGVGVVLSAMNHPGKATPEWLMVATVALACGLAWRERERERLSIWTVIALMLGGPVAFIFSAWSVGFGQTDAILWQAIAPTGPLLALLIVPLSRTVKILGFGAYVLTVGATAISAASASSQAAQITVVAGLVGVGLVLAVLSFMRSLAAVAAHTYREQQEAFALGLQLAAVEAADATRRRWRESGLEESVRLLRDIGEGRVHATTPAIQQQCAKEEAFLRQLTQLNPELIQMGRWFARALNVSRLRGVGLTLRTGAVDATTEDAQQFGRKLLTAVTMMPAGTHLTTAFFATARGLTMTLVAPTPHLIAALQSDAALLHTLTRQTLGNQDFVELVTARSPS